jgi:hypothetical protein
VLLAAATNLDKRTAASPIESKETAENGWYIITKEGSNMYTRPES